MTQAVSTPRRVFLLGLLLPAWPVHSEESWREMVERVLRNGNVGAHANTRSANATGSGSLWVANVRNAAPVRWTAASGFRSPVFSATDASVYAMRGIQLVRLAGPDTEPVVVHSAPGIRKLIGFDPDPPHDLLVLMDDYTKPLVRWSITSGQWTTLPVDLNDIRQQRALADMRGQSRYGGALSISVETQSRQDLAQVVEWNDVFVQEGAGERRNLSNGNGINCFQPALSPDVARVAYVCAEN